VCVCLLVYSIKKISATHHLNDIGHNRHHKPVQITERKSTHTNKTHTNTHTRTHTYTHYIPNISTICKRHQALRGSKVTHTHTQEWAVCTGTASCNLPFAQWRWCLVSLSMLTTHTHTHTIHTRTHTQTTHTHIHRPCTL
jgi:peroxiredoxin